MKFAQKMVLVPAEEFGTVVKAQAQNVSAQVKKSIQLQDNMKHLLSSHKKSKKSKKCKAYVYSKMLREYLHYKNNSTVQNNTPVITEKPIQTHTDSFVDTLPDIYRGKARVLLAHMEKQGVKWSNKGELTLPDGTVVTGSHGADLLRETLVGSRKKTKSDIHGWDSFLRSLAQTNVPQSVIGKKHTLSQLQMYKSHPSTTSKPEDSSKVRTPSWLSL